MYSGGEKLKEIHKQKLQRDLVKYSRQIGLEEIPYLTFDPKEFKERIVEYWKNKGVNYHQRNREKALGRCHDESKTILLNQNKHGYTWEDDRNKNGEKIKVRQYGQTYHRKRKIKINYIFWKKVLIHELVHYRFDKLQHGAKFEKRIREILCGRVFPAMNSNIPIVRPATEPAIIEDEDEHNKVYSYLVNRTQISET